jgi:hypothetical protein
MAGRRDACVAAALICLLAQCRAAVAQHDDMMPSGKPGSVLFMVSPLLGLNRNELVVRGRGGATVLEDTDPEQALFAMVVTPRVVANNIAFRTRPEYGHSDRLPEYAKVVGDIVTVNVYGPAESSLTWNLGLGYIWHEIDSGSTTIGVDMPIAKAGIVWRAPSMNMMVNPYVGYAREEVEVTSSRGSSSEGSHVMLYGVSWYWRWRMLQANAKYYIQDNRAENKAYDVLRGQFSAMFTRHAGVLVRAERMEESMTTDTSVLAGPIFVF